MTILNEIGHVENPSARIQFLQIAQTTPGQCGICGKGQSKEGFADTQLDFEFWGRLILCVDCSGQIAAVFGFISPIDYDELLGEKDLAQLQLHAAQSQIIEMEKIIEGFTNIRTYVGTVSSGTLDNLTGEPNEIIKVKTEQLPESSSIDGPDPVEHREIAKPISKQRLLNI